VSAFSPSGHETLTTSELLWIGKVEDRFEDAWKGAGSLDQRPRIEEYLGEQTGPARMALLRCLLEVDLDYRRRHEEQPTPAEYESRFSGHAELVRDAFAASLSRPTENWPVIPGYQIQDEIGRGGMGEVYRARDERLGRTLAVKVLQNRYRDARDMQCRFEEEARLTGQLQHPGVPPVHELGKTADGRPFFSMKLVKGQTLADLLRRRQGPGEELARFVSIFGEVCRAVAYAHSHGLLHRDLKPANVMVGAFGEAQVMDWGLAKAHGGEQAGRGWSGEASTLHTARPAKEADWTQDGSVLGTLGYMAPEQARGEIDRLDERSDVFGLGAILCVILTGRPPHEGATVQEVRRRAAEGELAEPLARLDGCGADAGLVQLCKQCLAAARDERPRNAGVVATRVAGYQAAAQERLRRVELEQAQARERLLGNAYAAQVAAGTVLLKWRLLSSAVEQASGAPKLWELLRDDNRRELQQFLERLHARYENEPLFKTWYVLDREGTLVGYWPVTPIDQEVLGGTYAGRDYFQGARQKTDGFPVHVSRIFRSVADDVYKVALSTPIRDRGQPDGTFLGVIAVSLTTDPVMGLPQFHDKQRKAVLVGRQDTNDPRAPGLNGPAERKYLILVHPAYRVGQEPVAIESRKLSGLLDRERSSDEFQLWDVAQVGSPDDYQDEDYHDPVACQESSLSGRWLAGFAPVGNTEFAVIVQQR
jgi:serine/threonine protein kinase